MEQESIGSKIRHLRQEKLMTQAELAGDRMTRSMLSLIENGASEPSLSTLRYLADRLRVSPAYLLAGPAESEMYRREKQIKDIRIAYSLSEFRICRDLCLAAPMGEDDERYFLIAECSLALAEERIFSGDLRGSGELLDEAVAYAGQTRYPTNHVYAEAAVLSQYIRRYSEVFYSDAEDAVREKGISLYASTGRPFCLYILLTESLSREEVPSEKRVQRIREESVCLSASSEPLKQHIEAMLLFKAGKLNDAKRLFEDLLRGTAQLPKTVLYDIFRDLEICCRESGDYKGAYESMRAKNDFLSRLLSEV